MKNGQPTQNPKERAEMIAKNLHLTLGGYPSPPSNVESETISVAKIQNISQNFNRRFTMTELTTCIQELPSDKATGEDDVHMFLENLTKPKLQAVLGLINHSWHTREVPSSWKNSNNPNTQAKQRTYRAKLL